MAINQPDKAPYKIIENANQSLPWIAMVHGVSQNHRLFDRQVTAFSNTYQIILIDLPGHGSASDIDGPYGLSEFATHIRLCLGQAGITSCHFWGTHLGASAGLILACNTSNIFNRLILEGPVYPGKIIPFVADFITRISATTRTLGIEAARKLWWDEGPWFDVIRANPEICRATEQLDIINEFGGQPWMDSGLITRPVSAIDDHLKVINIPTLIINGEHDMVEFMDVAAALENIMPNCRRAIIEDGGGFPLWEYPDLVNQIVGKFLKSEGDFGR